MHPTNFDQFERVTDPGTTSDQTLFFPTTSTPSALAVADLSNNGDLDLIATNTTVSDTVSVLAGNGDGTFQPAKQFDVGAGLSRGLISGDRPVALRLDPERRDTTPDLVVPNFNAGGISVLLGNGDGTFQPERPFNAVPNPSAMLTGDLNHDGHTDIIVRQSFTQNGPTRFAVPAWTRGRHLPAASLLHDGVLGGRSRRADGPGRFWQRPASTLSSSTIIKRPPKSSWARATAPSAQAPFSPPAKEPSAAAAADLTGDGTLDLITTSTNTGNRLRACGFGNGNGALQPPTAYPGLWRRGRETTLTVNGLAVVDFGKLHRTRAQSLPGPADGIPRSLIVTAAPRSGGAGEVILLPGIGDGTFGAPSCWPRSEWPGSVVAGDFGNGVMDLAVADTGGDHGDLRHSAHDQAEHHTGGSHQPGRPRACSHS